MRTFLSSGSFILLHGKDLQISKTGFSRDLVATEIVVLERIENAINLNVYVLRVCFKSYNFFMKWMMAREKSVKNH